MKAVLVFLFAIFYTATQGEDVKKVVEGSKGEAKVDVSSCRRIYLCKDNGTNRDSLVDIRDSSRCAYLFLCNSKQEIDDEPSPSSKKEMKNERCGVRNPEGLGFRITDEKANEANYGEFPWMAGIILEKENNPPTVFVYHCGGALIHPQIVITRAHCIGRQNEKLQVRLGDWNTQTDAELLPHQDRDVKTIIKHQEFNENTFANDIALLVLDKAVEIALHVNVVCLPKQNTVVDESKCFVSGWGKDNKYGKHQPMLKKLELPIVSRNFCQESLRKTPLGNDFKLHDTFICAGGWSDSNTCQVDGGSPLVCPVPGLPGRYMLVGIVSWGLGCETGGVLGVYTNVAKYSDWIDEQLTQKNYSLSYYKF